VAAGVWDTLTGDHKKAQAAFKKRSPGWKTAVKTLGDLGKAGKAAWDGLSILGKDAWNKDIKPGLDQAGKDWNKFAKDVLPLLGPAMDNVKKALSLAGKALGASFDLIITTLKSSWTGFWNKGAKQFVHDGLKLAAQEIGLSLKILEDAITFILAALSGKWDKAWGAMKDLVSTVLTGVKTPLEGGNKLLGDAAGAHMGARSQGTSLDWSPGRCPVPRQSCHGRAGRTTPFNCILTCL
jgi:hypothetical protein